MTISYASIPFLVLFAFSACSGPRASSSSGSPMAGGINNSLGGVRSQRYEVVIRRLAASEPEDEPAIRKKIERSAGSISYCLEISDIEVPPERGELQIGFSAGDSADVRVTHSSTQSPKTLDCVRRTMRHLLPISDGDVELELELHSGQTQ